MQIVRTEHYHRRDRECDVTKCLLHFVLDVGEPSPQAQHAQNSDGVGSIKNVVEDVKHAFHILHSYWSWEHKKCQPYGNYSDKIHHGKKAIQILRVANDKSKIYLKKKPDG